MASDDSWEPVDMGNLLFGLGKKARFAPPTTTAGHSHTPGAAYPQWVISGLLPE